MGLDLSLLPFDHESDRLVYSHSILDVERRRHLFEAILKIHADCVPDGFVSYMGNRPDGERGYGETKSDAYGSPLTYLHAGVLMSFWEHVDVTDNHKNRGVWAYLAQLPEDTKIALFWH